ncbi:MAG: dihydrodipicolinate synthase family protein [Pseudomonadota bacterium]
MAPTIDLPEAGGVLTPYTMQATPIDAPVPPAPFNRVAFAAAHVVADPLTSAEPSGPAILDWEATLAFRRHLLDLGLGIAEAMDTSQRGMGLDWPTAEELIARSLDAATAEERGRIFSGVGTDQLEPEPTLTLDDIIAAYLTQLHAVQRRGGRVILMASRALARVATGPDDYAHVYARVLAEADAPVILHWLGEMFDPALAGYWGHADVDAAEATLLALIGAHAAKIDGVKISLLDAAREVRVRAALPDGVRMYTGDDFNYPALIKGDGERASDALLGIFDPIAPAASVALSALAAGDEARFDAVLAPTVPLSRTIFRAPTRFYKTGIVFLAWLNGFQDHFVMVGGAQAMRPLPYFAEVFRQADQAGLLRSPDLAAARMRRLLALYGVGA